MFLGFVGMCVSGFTNLYLLTLEKRFQLTSTEVGFVAASNDIAGIVLTALVSFYGTYGNKPRWLGYGCAITGKLFKLNSLNCNQHFSCGDSASKANFVIIVKYACPCIFNFAILRLLGKKHLFSLWVYTIDTIFSNSLIIHAVKSQ